MPWIIHPDGRRELVNPTLEEQIAFGPLPVAATPWRVTWSEDMSVGIAAVDAEHRGFLSLVNDLNRAVLDRSGKAEIERISVALLRDATRHFEHEEKLLAERGYPDASGHGRLHQALMSQIAASLGALRDSFLERYWEEEALKIKNALVDHLLQEDMKYRDYFRSRPAAGKHGTPARESASARERKGGKSGVPRERR